MAKKNTTTHSQDTQQMPKIDGISALLALVRPKLPKDRESQFFHFYLGLFEQYANSIGVVDGNGVNFTSAIDRARRAAKVYEDEFDTSPDAISGLYRDVVAWFYFDACGDYYIQEHLKAVGKENWVVGIDTAVEAWYR